jgi:hypothetical protein
MTHLPAREGNKHHNGASLRTALCVPPQILSALSCLPRHASLSYPMVGALGQAQLLQRALFSVAPMRHRDLGTSIIV